jgi:hypothetical protein
VNPAVHPHAWPARQRATAARRPIGAALPAALLLRPLLLLLLLLPLACATAQADTPPKRAGAPPAGAPEEIDQAVRQISAFVQRNLPDREGDALVVLPFLSDQGGRVVLGERLAGELELALAGAYRRLRLGGGSGRIFTLMGQLEPYASRLRVLCRLLGPEGEQLAVGRAELRMSGELKALLVAPVGDEYSGRGLHVSGEEDSLAQDLDPMEPDDAEGAEVQLIGGGAALERYLSPGDIDRFRFYVAQTQPVRLEVQTALDSQLVLYREGERVPFEVRGNPSGASILFEASLAPGYYVAELLAFNPEVEGPYTIHLAAAQSPDPFEPDDTPAEARPLAAGSSQERTLAAGNPDWVELSEAPPGFYALFTSGLEVDTSLTLFRDGRVPVLADEDGGPQANAFLAFFLGPGRWLARVEGRPPLAEGRYSLGFQSMTPEKIAPAPTPRQVILGDRPTVLQLRILAPGRYRVLCPGAEVELYSLPDLRSLAAGGPVELAAGDYLLLLKGPEGLAASLAVAEE